MKVLKNKATDIILIDDSYNFSIEAIKLGLETARKIQSKRKIAVIGEMSALGEQTAEIHQELGEFLKSLNFDAIYTIGEYTKYFGKEGHIKKFRNREELILELDQNIKNGDLIYVKGSNAQHFDNIVNHIKEKYEVT